MAAEHFLDCGLRHFAYIAFGEGWWINMCQEAFCKVLEERGYDCAAYLPPARGRNASILHEHQLPGLVDFIRFLPRPCGVLTPGDLHAVRLLNVCREFDITVPEDMAILGVGNDAVICETVRPTLSSMDLDARRIGYEAAKLLDLRMAGKDMTDVVLVSPSHVAVRQSTNLMVIEDADVVQAMRFIRDYACTGIDVPRVADAVGMSRRVLERRFYRYLGRTPNAEILRIQIDRAKLLLSRTDKTRESIARQSGFATPEYFSRAFRREVGMTANAFRKKAVFREIWMIPPNRMMDKKIGENGLPYGKTILPWEINSKSLSIDLRYNLLLCHAMPIPPKTRQGQTAPACRVRERPRRQSEARRRWSACRFGWTLPSTWCRRKRARTPEFEPVTVVRVAAPAWPSPPFRPGCRYCRNRSAIPSGSGCYRPF